MDFFSLFIISYVKATINGIDPPDFIAVSRSVVPERRDSILDLTEALRFQVLVAATGIHGVRNPSSPLNWQNLLPPPTSAA